MRIANKISISFLGTAIFILSFSGPIFYFNARDALRDCIYAHFATTLQLRADHIKTILEEYKKNTKLITSENAFKNVVDPGKNSIEAIDIVNRRITGILQEKADILRISVIDRDGIVIASSYDEEVGINKQNEEFFLNWIKGDWVNDLHISSCNEDYGLCLVEPIKVNRKYSGFLKICYSAENLFRITTNRTGLGKTGEIYLVNKNHYMIAPSHSLKDVIINQKIDTENCRECFSHSNLSKKTHPEIKISRDYKGIKVLGSHLFIPEVNWCLLVEIDVNEALAPLKRIWIVFLLIIISVPLVAWLIGVTIAKLITRPIQRLKEGSKIIGSGNLDYRVGRNAKDEIGQLSRDFDKMTENLKRTTISISKLNKEIEERKKIEKALRESEARFIDLYENAPNAYFSVGVDGIIYKCNRHAIELLGYSGEEMIGRQIFDLFTDTPEGKERVLTAFRKSNDGEKIFDEEMQIKKLDSTSSWISLTVVPIFDINGQVIEHRAMAVDITKRKEAEGERKKMQLQLLHSSKLASIGTLAAGVGHEINNPLTIAKGFLDIVKIELESKNVFDDNLKDSFEKQINALERIKNIVNGLRTYARSDTEIIENVDLHKIINDTIAFCNVIFKKENIRIDTGLKSTNPVISGNIGKLQQVIMNLLTNAKDAIQEVHARYGGRIKIKTSDKENFIVLKVSDNGPGIDKKDLEHIFDPFFTTKAPGKGTGLGLSVIHSIITSFGGKISVDTEKGIGTAFTITLPTTKQEETFKTEEEIVFRGELSGRILLVDDDEGIREIIRYYLNDFGLIASEASDGTEALEKLKKEKFDYVITDLKMQKMNGEELIFEAKKLGIETKFLVITGGYITDYTKKQRDFIRENADGYLRKPFSRKLLFNSLKSLDIPSVVKSHTLQ